MLPQADMELEVDPDPTLEREAEETAQQVMKGGALDIQRMADTSVHVQRAPKTIIQRSIKEKLGFGGENNHSEPKTNANRAQIQEPVGFESFDDGELDETVSTLISNQESLIENQQSLMDAFVTAEPGTAGMDPVADATKGAAGTLASTAAGAAIGSAIPAIGPLGGAVIGAAASDVTKSTVGWMMDYRPGGDAEAMENKIAELESRLAELEEGSDTGSRLEGKARSRSE